MEIMEKLDLACLLKILISNLADSGNTGMIYCLGSIIRTIWRMDILLIVDKLKQ
ncbi:7032_t:CDS:1, partial [Entrophospora sp. SA101]